MLLHRILSPLHHRYRDWLDERLNPEFVQKLLSLPTRQNEYGYDSFGFNRDEAKIAVLLVQYMYRYYFRAQAYGTEHIPPGRVLLIANHSGQLPFDGMVITGSLLFDMDPPRVARSMIERYVPSLPYVSFILNRWGQVVGTPENCIRLLDDEEVVLVFPEGVGGISKPFSKRYQLQKFGHGFMRLALESRCPIVPVAVIGAEEQAPAFNVEPLAKLFRAPAFPVVPFPPFLPIVPLPVRYRLYFGPPMTIDADPDLDDEEIAPLVAEVRSTIQSMIHLGLKERRHVFW
ncbi:MAG: acyltransferase family protein [Deltaproteobacteria bacterium]|nr:acyltransferase family protein [Deltaproteobacteria bacterium]